MWIRKREKQSEKGAKMSARKKKSRKKPTLSISSKCLGSEMISEEIQLPDTLGLEPAFLFPPPSHSEKG